MIKISSLNKQILIYTDYKTNKKSLFDYSLVYLCKTYCISDTTATQSGCFSLSNTLQAETYISPHMPALYINFLSGEYNV